MQVPLLCHQVGEALVCRSACSHSVVKGLCSLCEVFGDLVDECWYAILLGLHTHEWAIERRS